MQKLFHIIPFLCLCIFQVTGEGTREVSGDTKKASSFIEKVVKEALGIVNNSNSSDDQKRKKLSECINKYLDIDRITKAVFSPRGYRELSQDDQQKVKEYMKEYLIRFYASEGKLSAMMDSTLSACAVAEKKGNEDFAVTTNFEKNSSQALKIVWITDGKKVFYVEIEGINQIITLRSEMNAAIGSSELMEYIKKNKN